MDNKDKNITILENIELSNIFTKRETGELLKLCLYFEYNLPFKNY